MANLETKRINGTTYIYREEKDLLAEIKGPYTPGGVWKAEVYKTNDKFKTAWKEKKLTPVQRGKVTSGMDKVIAAMTWGQTNALDSSLYTENICLGYRYKRKADATQAAVNVLTIQLWV